MSLKNKNILLAVTGGIAAYKTVALTSLLTKAGADVHVVMTPAATQFVTKTTFHALSRNPVHEDLFTEEVPHQIAHIDLADRADLVVIAPATANTIGKLANGIADNLVTTIAMATQAPIWIAPAMNVNMFQHPTLQTNLERLKEHGCRILDPGVGTLACGWIGKGRMAEPEAIFTAISDYFHRDTAVDLVGKKFLVTAGPTREAIDPVRYLTNRSSGKMGYAIARMAAAHGAEVTLITGPTHLEAPLGVQMIHVESAEEMYEAVIEQFEQTDVVVKTAAVADYRPKTFENNKVKKSADHWTLELVQNPDILEELGRRKTNQVLIGFAAETENVESYARKKLKKKRLDMIVANDVARSDAGFDSDNNEVTFYYHDGKVRTYELMAKDDVASRICSAAADLLESERSR
ncbi:bifunctional phosphopantothenoylcysteine decarboxylase/phosphopantothenate--cysteine ligase CoaBC [Camelliibacillus cellulosilyticus]|uniref:Coenzyme A biosynthesis bifunctional protein CoaBC n=1 Tax=Camelliibacillus cellulosilyticus TaxID=2174486 RepID=A0ABV9GG86_9BACL